MKCQVIPVNIQNPPPVAPGYIVRINLLVVCQHDCRAAAGNIHATECLNVSWTVSLLIEDNGPIPDFQAALINTGSLYNQGSFADFMQVVTFHTINLPVYGGILVHNNTGPGPGTSVWSGDSVVISKCQWTGTLRDRVFQVNLTIMSQECQIFTCVQVRTFLPVHGIFIGTLFQRASAGAAVKFPLQGGAGWGIKKDGSVIILWIDLWEKTLRNKRIYQIGPPSYSRVNTDQFPLPFGRIPAK